VEQVTADVVSVIQLALPLPMDSLNELIQRLQQLHLEQERILTALEIIVADNEPNEPAPVTVPVRPMTPAPTPALIAVPVPVHPTTPVAVPAPREPASPVAPLVAVFHIGQRVYITNRITHVLVRRATEADRTAIVTHFTPSRVAICTNNGFKTHRHPKNLRPL
jgi:hypothetical protein